MCRPQQKSARWGTGEGRRDSSALLGSVAVSPRSSSCSSSSSSTSNSGCHRHTKQQKSSRSRPLVSSSLFFIPRLLRLSAVVFRIQIYPLKVLLLCNGRKYRSHFSLPIQVKAFLIFPSKVENVTDGNIKYRMCNNLDIKRSLYFCVRTK